MTRGNSWVEREYGKRLVKNRFLFTVFAIVFTAVAVCLLLPLLIANNDTLLAKTGTAASITGVFIGTYIATWLINQNRTKNITENYFYKVGILTSTIEMLNGAILFIEKTKSEYTKHQIDEYHVEEYPEVVPKFFEYNKDLAEIINSNTLVPADTRTDVVSLLQHGTNLIMEFSENQAIDSEIVQDMLHHLDEVFKSDYFMNDKSKKVQQGLEKVKQIRNEIEQRYVFHVTS